MSFITNWLVYKPGQSLLLVTAVILFAACRREEAKLDLKTKGQDYQVGSYFTDTVTVKASTVYVKDSTVSSNAFLMCGAYHDDDLGNVWVKAFTQIRPTRENADFTGAVVTSTLLRLDYGYAYGDTLEDQTFDVYKLPFPLDKGTTYYTISPSPNLSALTPIGSATFQARPNTPNSYIDIVLNNSFGQQVLNASNGSTDLFLFNIYGLAIVPRDQDKGAIIQLSFSGMTAMAVSYTLGGLPFQELYTINNNSARYYTTGFDRSGTPIASLVNSYDELPSSATSDKVFLQSMTGLKVKFKFPYIKNFLFQPEEGNVLINKAALYMPIQSGTNAALSEPTALAMLMTDANGKILKENNQIRFVQSDYASAIGTSSSQIIYTDYFRKYYTGYLSSYLLANQLGQIPYQRPIILSPIYTSTEVNRVVFNASAFKLKAYYTIIK